MSESKSYAKLNSTVCRCEFDTSCVWEYSGQGLEFQLLAGPSFIVMFTVSGVVMGWLADKIHRPRLLALATAIFSTSCILMGVANEFWQLVVLRMGIALGSEFFFNLDQYIKQFNILIH